MVYALSSEEKRMIQISEEWLNMLMDRVVKDKIEVHVEFTPDTTSVEMMPWKPYEMKCPYAEGKEE